MSVIHGLALLVIVLTGLLSGWMAIGISIKRMPPSHLVAMMTPSTVARVTRDAGLVICPTLRGHHLLIGSGRIDIKGGAVAPRRCHDGVRVGITGPE
jgi:hypothetical protein